MENKWRRRINDPPFPSKNFVLNYSFGIFFFISTTNTSTTETMILRVIIVFHYSPIMYHAKGLFQKHIPVIVPVLNIYWCYVCKIINLLWFLRSLCWNKKIPVLCVSLWNKMWKDFCRWLSYMYKNIFLLSLLNIQVVVASTKSNVKF